MKINFKFSGGALNNDGTPTDDFVDELESNAQEKAKAKFQNANPVQSLQTAITQSVSAAINVSVSTIATLGSVGVTGALAIVGLSAVQQAFVSTVPAPVVAVSTPPIALPIAPPIPVPLPAEIPDTPAPPAIEQPSDNPLLADDWLNPLRGLLGEEGVAYISSPAIAINIPPIAGVVPASPQPLAITGVPLTGSSTVAELDNYIRSICL
jgi:hypothetical protein